MVVMVEEGGPVQPHTATIVAVEATGPGCLGAGGWARHGPLRPRMKTSQLTSGGDQ